MRWPGYRPDDEEWAESSPSEGGKAIRHGIDYLLTHPWYRFAGRPVTPLTALEALRWMERALELERALLIAQARFEGASWNDVARQLGLTKQAVYRYNQVVKDLIAIYSKEDGTGEEVMDYIDANFNAWVTDPYGYEEDVAGEGEDA
ncbi:hypothetical protein DFJ66_2575 [Saccharothrix variisporea]|uniref:Sigma-70-like protein n=2 Tax=Saccharothrix variisporea TaxID=543527 RepID=A0A495X7B8_9PSEU|nr:hypothetical protein DFJ66_2575 [Saccharothrix variisporea]